MRSDMLFLHVFNIVSRASHPPREFSMSAAPRLLLVEDSPEDYETTVRALRKTGMMGEVFRD